MKLHRLIKSSCSFAAADIGKEQADRIAETAQKRYEELCRENEADLKEVRVHTYKRIYPGIAVYETMKAAGVEQDKAISYIHAYFDSFIGKNVVPHLQRIIKLFGLAKKMPKIFLKMVDSSFSPAACFEYEWPQAKENEVRFNIVKCPYFETCKRYGCPELTVVYCDSDDVTYGNMHPKLKWGRTKTIGRGNDCCDFLLEYRD